MIVSTAAHPRSRGENIARAQCITQARGSSPLTRGKPVRMMLFSFFEGLIPAHAGKTQDRTARLP